MSEKLYKKILKNVLWMACMGAPLTLFGAQNSNMPNSSSNSNWYTTQSEYHPDQQASQTRSNPQIPENDWNNDGMNDQTMSTDASGIIYYSNYPYYSDYYYSDPYYNSYYYPYYGSYGYGGYGGYWGGGWGSHGYRNWHGSGHHGYSGHSGHGHGGHGGHGGHH